MKLVKRKTNKKIIIITIIFMFLWVIGVYMYKTYNNIKITPGNYQTEKIQSTVYAENVEKTEEKSQNLADVIDDVTKSVVGISKLKNTGNTIFSSSDEGKLGLGTGIIVGQNGYILSNEHLTGEKFSKCYVTLEDGKNYNGTVAWSDKDLDLSIVKINENNLPVAKLADSSKIRVGETVYAIGNPIGFEFRRTVTSGIISAKNRTIKIEEGEEQAYMTDLIQTDATINPGNSGGPLIYPNGEVIGINTVKISSAEGIGFAVPINVVKKVIENFNQNNKFEEATIGIYGYDKEVVPYLTSNKIQLSKGIYVAKIIPNGPASKTDLQEEDIITTFDGTEIETMNDLKQYIYTKNPGDTITITINRGRINKEISIQLGRK
ncbi:MAG: trypsin-like peptidase domain-containing protein [Clostridia bacterium]|nr:trypsin-like peptidase domain-containing protein [Clostridia bacterium]